MNFNTMRATFVATAATCLLLAGGAQAAELVNGAYYGTGNDYAPGNWTVNTQTAGGSTVELGLRGHVYQQPAQAPAGNVYVIPLGSVISLDWSFDVLAGIYPSSLFSTLTITNLAGGSATYDALLTPDNAQNPNGFGGEQNSLRLSFAFLNGSPVGDINYDANVDSTYNVTFTVTGTNLGTVTNSIVLQQGAGATVPEPGTWALLILGFGAAGATLRSRRQRLAL
jgi:hypothetical protein